MKAPDRKPPASAPARKPEPAKPPRPGPYDARTSAYSPELMAQLAVARKPTTPSGHRVKYAVTLFLPHDVAEYIIARAIREGRNVPALIGELLSREAAGKRAS